ncbi:leucine-rich repeat domain-containing protein [Capnocytophaga leadbetteri]|uniref:leucine-rich repeat domain-containing protein n=1 Tax=Capnocytophaga leadbetteri TaxID=327575 RepID=UPI002889DBA6|nr:leucine-rich repeat domain-containing protein [Capnocytophaga leadbetteri]
MRTKILKFIAVLSMVLLAFNGCKKDEGEEPNPTPQPKTPENVVVFDKEVIEKKIDTITNDGTLVFSSLSEKEKPKVGDIICSGVAQGAPQGFLYKVKDIQEKNGKTTIITEKAYLEDAIGDGEFEQNIIISARDVQAIYNSKGEQVENQIKLPPLNSSTERPYDVQAYDTKLESSIKFEIDTELEKNLKLKGSVEAGISLDFKIKIGFLKVEELALIVNPQIKGEIKVAWSKKLKGKEEGKNYELGVIKLAPITVPISGIPVVITPKIIIILHVDIEGKIELSGKILSVEASPKFGPVYKNGHWSFLGMNEGDNKDLINVDFFKEVKFGLSGELKIGPRIIADYTFYNSDTGAGLGIGFYGKLKSDLAVKVEPSFEQIKDLEFDPKITLSAGIEAIYKTELNIFRFKAELEGSKEFLKWQIAEHHIFPKFSELVTSLDPEGNKVVACKVERMPSRLLWSVSQHGFCWTDKDKKPTIEDTRSELGELAGTILDLDAYEMKVKLPTLLPNSTYRIRPYYTFWGGTYYGSELTFNTEQPKEFKLSANTLNLKKGENSTVKITSGNDTYVVSSSNKTVATASVSDTNKKEIVIVAHNKGTATIIVEDNVSKTKKEIKVTVTEADNNLVLSANSITLKEGEHKVVNITSGSGVYIVKSNNESVVLANEVKAGVIGIIAKGAGNATVIVKDKATKQQKTIEVTVTKAHPSLVVTSKTAELIVGGQYRINITSGSGKYSVSSQNSHIATASLSGNAIDIVGKSKGNTTVLLEDKESKETVSIAVKVSPKEENAEVPEGVIIKDGVLITWPCDKIPTNGHVTIPSGITAIDRLAFLGCSSLKSITIPNSVTSIGRGAFEGCSKLSSITIPNSVTSIGKEAFAGCSKLSSIVIPNSVTSIGSYAFSKCDSLSSIVIPNSVTSIGWGAFEGCSKLSSITIPNSVTSIGDFAFSRCDSLSSIVIPNSVTSIGEGAFYKCSSLSSITIPNSVTSIGDAAFKECSLLSSITIPNSVTSIGDKAFYKCSKLSSITIPNSVTSIGIYAFYECSKLSSITIPNSVTSIGSYAFYECSKLSSITIPNSVTSIGSYAFYKCSSLSSITIPNSVTSIGKFAFKGCSSLSSITIPNSVKNIEDNIFQDCTSLKSVSIPNSVTSIGNYAFSWCSSLSSITIPNSVTSIGWYAFLYCNSLQEIICKATTPPETNITLSYNKKLIVPKGTKHLYEKAKGWKDCSPIVEEE